MARFLRTETNSSGGHSRLRDPVVVTPAAAPFFARPVQVNPAADRLRRNFRAVARTTKSRLYAPTVVTLTGEFTGPVVTLSPSFRGKAKARLQPPTTVTQVEAPVTTTAVTLARITPPRTRSFIRSPIVVNSSVADAVADVTLAYSLRGKPKSTLRPPTVVAPVLASPISTTLVRIRPVATRWLLRRPVDLVDRDDLGSVRVHLAYSLRGKAKPHLSPPAVVAPVLAKPIDATLARIRPVRTSILLRRPVDLVDREDVGSVKTHLAYSLRGTPKYRLAPPAVVAPVLARAIEFTLVRIRPVPTQAILGRPVDLVDAADLGFLSETLAYSRRGAPKSSLNPPTVVAPVLAPPIDTTLTRIRPAATHPVLRRPVDLVDRDDLGFVSVHLAYSLRGTPKSRLTPPTVVTPESTFVASPVVVRLAPSARQGRKATYDLSGPFVINAPPRAKGRTATQFVQPPRTLVHSRLRPPAVVDREDVGTLRVHIAPSSRGKAKPFLRAPGVVAVAFIATPVLVILAYSRRGKPLSGLGQPKVLLTEQYYLQGPMVQYVQPPRQARVIRSRLAGAVVGDCYGDVVGFDFAPEVCGSDEGATVIGTTSADRVSGSDSGATVQGASASRGSVTGGDEKREGC